MSSTHAVYCVVCARPWRHHQSLLYIYSSKNIHTRGAKPIEHFCGPGHLSVLIWVCVFRLILLLVASSLHTVSCKKYLLYVLNYCSYLQLSCKVCLCKLTYVVQVRNGYHDGEHQYRSIIHKVHPHNNNIYHNTGIPIIFP